MGPMADPKPKRLTREERRRLTREQLLIAGREVFEENGYADSSVEEIAERAGYTRKAVYSNFSGKADLLLSIVERQFQSHIELVESILGQGPAERQALDLGAAFSAYFSEERPWEQLFHEFCTVAARDKEIGDRFRSQFREAKRELTRLVLEQAEIQEVKLTLPAERLVLGLFALLSGVAIEKLIDPEQIDDSLFGDMLGLIAASAIKPGRP
jgi:AcrR family transcriptional regulator